jgi:hypothetical protein
VVLQVPTFAQCGQKASVVTGAGRFSVWLISAIRFGLKPAATLPDNPFTLPRSISRYLKAEPNSKYKQPIIFV